MSNTEAMKGSLRRCLRCPHRLSDLASHEKQEASVGLSIAKKCASNLSMETESGEDEILQSAGDHIAESGSALGEIQRQYGDDNGSAEDGDGVAAEMQKFGKTADPLGEEIEESESSIHGDLGSEVHGVGHSAQASAQAPRPPNDGMCTWRWQYRSPYAHPYSRIGIESIRFEAMEQMLAARRHVRSRHNPISFGPGYLLPSLSVMPGPSIVALSGVVGRIDEKIRTDWVLDDLKRFGERLKLTTPVPLDLVPILTKDEAKRKEIAERGRYGAKQATSSF